MSKLKRHLSLPLSLSTPSEPTISIKVPRKTLQNITPNGLAKTSLLRRTIPFPSSRRVTVEASEQGTSDSVFYAPESANVDESHQRATPVQFIKTHAEHADAVRDNDEFEIAFVGMSVGKVDWGGNELLVCSLARGEDVVGGIDRSDKAKMELEELSALPTALTIHPGDVPFLHYDPVVDGHDIATGGDCFVPMPGSKRVYIQRRGGRDLHLRFTVIEVDKLSEEQLIAIKSLEHIGKSVSKAAKAVKFLKVISGMLKVANFLGGSALNKVSEPEHVLSKDMTFLLGGEGREEYGNYLRYGYYFFLNAAVDAKMYAQTGASSHHVPLLLRRIGRDWRGGRNERELFPLSGVSYVVVKVSRGCSTLDEGQRREQLERHRKRVVDLLKKYTGKLGEDDDE